MEASELLSAPAKLNLTLEVLGRRPDGLHGLRSVMVPVDVCDRLTITPAARFSFRCDRAGLMTDNLVERAARAVVAEPRFEVMLEKQIPTGAGMGGGSSDAAAILLAAASGRLGDVPAHEYVSLARSLGSDVPFFLLQAAGLVEGTGERVTALGAPPPWHAVIVKPPVAVSTADAYRALDEHDRPSRARSTSVSIRLGEALQRAQFDDVIALMQNDFHDVISARHPEVGVAVAALESAGATRAMLTGSGSCVFALAETIEEREQISGTLRLPAGYEIFACALHRGSAWLNAA